MAPVYVCHGLCAGLWQLHHIWTDFFHQDWQWFIDIVKKKIDPASEARPRSFLRRLFRGKTIHFLVLKGPVLATSADGAANFQLNGLNRSHSDIQSQLFHGGLDSETMHPQFYSCFLSQSQLQCKSPGTTWHSSCTYRVNVATFLSHCPKIQIIQNGSFRDFTAAFVSTKFKSKHEPFFCLIQVFNVQTSRNLRGLL